MNRNLLGKRNGVFLKMKRYRYRHEYHNFCGTVRYIENFSVIFSVQEWKLFLWLSTRVSDPHPFHADPDPGFEIYADADPVEGVKYLRIRI